MKRYFRTWTFEQRILSFEWEGIRRDEFVIYHHISSRITNGYHYTDPFISKKVKAWKLSTYFRIILNWNPIHSSISQSILFFYWCSCELCKCSRDVLTCKQIGFRDWDSICINLTIPDKTKERGSTIPAVEWLDYQNTRRML